MNQQEKKKLINNIEALINISDGLAKSFDFKTKELIDKYQKEIRQYNELKRLLEGKPLDIKFEMEYLNGNWNVSIPGCPDFDTGFIPGDILTHINNNIYRPGIIKMIKDFETGDGRKFNIYFEKTREHIISGTITENRENFAPYTDLQDTSTSGRKSKIKEFQEFIMFLKDKDEFCDWLLGQFYKKWKPLFDNGCFNENSQS